LAENAHYMAVSDGYRFVLLSSTPEMRARDGHTVQLSALTDGRVLVSDEHTPINGREEHARRAIGEKLARETQRTFLETIPPGFSGRVQPAPPGSPYMAVSSGSRFILIPSSAEARALSGTTVDVLRDAHGRFAGLRPRERDRGR
jgi:hypothetical protein